jgi:hypothetical protein
MEILPDETEKTQTKSQGAAHSGPSGDYSPGPSGHERPLYSAADRESVAHHGPVIRNAHTVLFLQLPTA